LTQTGTHYVRNSLREDSNDRTIAIQAGVPSPGCFDGNLLGADWKD
jgi:hypothetical protein